MGNHWTLEEAGHSFEALVEAARRGEPQRVGEGGEAVVVVSSEEYSRLVGLLPPDDALSLAEHLRRAPKLPEGMENVFDERDLFPAQPRDFELR